MTARELRLLSQDLLNLIVPSMIKADFVVYLDAETQLTGHALGKNDLWIAATCIASGTRLLTTDRDFDRLVPLRLDIDEASHIRAPIRWSISPEKCKCGSRVVVRENR